MQNKIKNILASFCTLILIIFSIRNVQATICLGCPGGGGGAPYNCGTIGDTLYVDASRPNDSGAGTSWSSAKRHLQNALYIASDCDNVKYILVAGGTYNPMVFANNRDYTYYVGNDISIQGGYAPGGSALPNHVLYQTILDGEYDTNINAHHIMVIEGNSGTVSISGFIFRNGFADGSGSLEITSGSFMNRNDGAAVYIKNNDDVRFTNCIFFNNVANDDGGGIYSVGSTMKYVNCIFANNTAANNGGGFYMQSSSVANFTNCAFVLNSYLTGGGGAIYNTTGSDINVYNSILWGNTNTWNGGGIRNVWYSVKQDNNSHNGGTSTNNTNADPEFLDMYNIKGVDGDYFTVDDGLMVCRGSICVNRGYNDALNIPNQDIKRDSRFFNAQVDIGPYENENYPSANGIPIHGDSTVARVYSGRTSIPLTNCKVLSILEPNSDINRQFKTVVLHNNSILPSYNEYTKFVDRYYYLERIPIGNFTGRITLFFTNTDFGQFNDDPYSINDLPEYPIVNESHLRIVKFGGVSTTYLPDSYANEPELINPDDADISYNIISGIWTVTFENTGSLGTYFVTTVYDYILNGGTDFSNTNNWNNNIKPNAVLPSLNRIYVTYPYHCTLNEPLELKPFSQFNFITPI